MLLQVSFNIHTELKSNAVCQLKFSTVYRHKNLKVINPYNLYSVSCNLNPRSSSFSQMFVCFFLLAKSSLSNKNSLLVWLVFIFRHQQWFMMDPSDNVENLNHRVEAVALSDGSACDSSNGQKDTTPSDMLRFFPNACFNISSYIILFWLVCVGLML